MLIAIYGPQLSTDKANELLYDNETLQGILNNGSNFGMVFHVISSIRQNIFVDSEDNVVGRDLQARLRRETELQLISAITEYEVLPSSQKNAQRNSMIDNFKNDLISVQKEQKAYGDDIKETKVFINYDHTIELSNSDTIEEFNKYMDSLFWEACGVVLGNNFNSSKEQQATIVQKLKEDGVTIPDIKELADELSHAPATKKQKKPRMRDIKKADRKARNSATKETV